MTVTGVVGDHADHASITQTLMAVYRSTVPHHALDPGPAQGQGLGLAQEPGAGQGLGQGHRNDSFVLSQKDPTTAAAADATAAAAAATSSAVTADLSSDPTPPDSLVRPLSSAAAAYRRVRW